MSVKSVDLGARSVPPFRMERGRHRLSVLSLRCPWPVGRRVWVLVVVG